MFFHFGILCVVAIVVVSASSPPHMHRTEEVSEQLYMEGEELKLPCTAKGDPEPTYQWKKDGKLIDLKKNNVTQDEGTLVIEHPKAEHEGEYQCLASNDHGTAVTAPVTLKRAFSESFRSTEDVGVFNPRQGAYLQIKCRPPASYPPGKAEWFVDHGEDATPEKTPVHTDKRVSLDYNGNLHFANVIMADGLEFEESYQCAVANHFIRTLSYGKYHKVNPVEVTPTTRTPRLMWCSTLAPIAIVGERLAMKCIFSGYPTPDVVWEKVGSAGDLPSSVTVDETGLEMVISKVSMTDEGKYKCCAHSCRTGLSKRFDVKVEERPTWVEEIEDQELVVGDNATFECQADGVPIPNIRWTIDNKELPLRNDSSLMERIVVDKNSLSIMNVTLSDSMVIQCSAGNGHGYLLTNACLHVVGAASSLGSHMITWLIILVPMLHTYCFSEI